MKTVEEVKEYLCDHGWEETIVFENPDYAPAFIGVDTDGRAVYDFEKMVEALLDEWGGQTRVSTTLMRSSSSSTTR